MSWVEEGPIFLWFAHDFPGCGLATADGNGDPLADGGPLPLQHFCREQEKDHSVLSLLKSAQVIGTWGPRVLFLVTELVSQT